MRANAAVLAVELFLYYCQIFALNLKNEGMHAGSCWSCAEHMTPMYSNANDSTYTTNHSCFNGKALVFVAHKPYHKLWDDFEHVKMQWVLIHCIA